MEQTPRAEPRAVLAVDVEKFSDPSRTNHHREIAQDGLYEALHTAFHESNIGEGSWYEEDRGDGALFLFTPDVPKQVLSEFLLRRMGANLLRYNATVTLEARIRLRVALHFGEVTVNDKGVVGDCVNHTFRLLDAQPLRTALAGSSSLLAVIVSKTFYEDVLRHDPAAEPMAYRQVEVKVKETSTEAWMRLSPESMHAEPRPAAPVAPVAELREHTLVGNGDQIGLLAELITRMPLMAGLDARRLCLEFVNTSLAPDPLVVTEFTDARRHVFAIVLACVHRPRALRSLLRALRHLEPEATELEQIADVVSGMAPLELFSDDDRRTITELLRGTDFPQLSECYRAAAGDQAAPLPSGRQDPVDVLARLEHVNARPDGLPPALALLEHLALHAGDVLSQRLWQFSERQAAEMGLHAELAVLRGTISAVATEAVAPTEASLVLRVQPHGVLPDQYLLSEWRQTRAHWSPQRGGDYSGSLAELRVRAGELVAGAEGWAENASSISIEFILPKDLLNLPVDQWLAPSDEVAMPIGIDYPVWLRSLERSRDKEKHRRWRRRYAQLQAYLQAGDSPIDDAVHRSQLDGPRHRHLQKLAAKLALAENVVLLVLADPPSCPNSLGRQEVAIAFKTGVPVLLWHREDCASKAFQTAVEDLLADGGLGKLLENVKKLRGQALISDDCDTHPGSHLSILVDDPNRQVEPLPQEVTAP